MRASRIAAESLTSGPALSATPRVSVVMPAHNALPFLDASIQSILTQTFADFEFVILDDGSTDATGAALREWRQKDQRIRVFTSRKKLGLVGSSNYVVTQARAPLIARMDADDVAHPDRLRRQWEILQKHPGAQMVGTLWEGIDARGRRVRPRDRWRLVRRSSFAPFPHGSIMFRRQAFEQIGGYREDCDFWEDLDFFIRIAATGSILVIPKALYQYRFHGNGSRMTIGLERVEQGVGLMYRCMAARSAGRDYDALLRQTKKGESAPRKWPPSVFTSIGSAHLWAGHTPCVFGALMRRGALGWNLETAQALLWSGWGAVSPASLRLFLRCFIRARDLAVSQRLKNRELFEWRFE